MKKVSLEMGGGDEGGERQGERVGDDRLLIGNRRI